MVNMNTMQDLYRFYASHSVMTDPGQWASLMEPMPVDTEALCKVVQGLLLHPFATGLYDVELTSVQRKEVNIRPVHEMLQLLSSLDNSPLDMTRPANDRLVGNCRDHAVLLCAFLRQKGIPARVRVGFATYFGPEMHYDHWVTEVWDAKSQTWKLVDAQLDDVQRKHYGIIFDPLDMSNREFITASLAWKLVRSGDAKSGMFGHNRHARGMGFIRNSLFQEFAALNKVEVLPWDFWWELGEKDEDQVTADERAFLDLLSELALSPDERFIELRSVYDENSILSQPVNSRLKVLGLGDLTEEGLKPMSVSGFQPSDIERLRSLGNPDRKPDDEPRTAERQTAEPRSAGRTPVFINPLLAPLDPDHIIVRGAQQHNLKHIDVKIPRYKMVVITGVSGSGKSSLAFDTLYAEGQRRYVESMSSYVRRYLEQMDKPRVDYIGGLSPAIAIEQKSVSKNPRSTVATVTEVMDYLRVLYSSAGVQHCPQCGRTVEPQSVQSISETITTLPVGYRFQILAPLARGRKTDVTHLASDASAAGFNRLRIDGEVYELDQGKLPRFKKSEVHDVDIVVDRLVVPDTVVCDNNRTDFFQRVADSVETALKTGKGLLALQIIEPSPTFFGGNGTGSGDAGASTDTKNAEAPLEFLLGEENTCPYCEISLPKLTASLFSFNAPTGMCPACNGLGTKLEIDVDLIITNPELSLLDGASRWHGDVRKKKNSWHIRNLESIADHYGVDLELPWNRLPESFRNVILYGSGSEKIHFEFENQEGTWKGETNRPVQGAVFHINRLFRQTQSEYTRRWYMSFMSQQPCPGCEGTRMCAEARTVTVGDKTFPQVLKMSILQAHEWVVSLTSGDHSLDSETIQIAGEVLKELESRLMFALNVGLHYLTLDRPAPTLSGGEGQRIRLASQLGCGLVGVMYILDEPSIGLHARDQRALIDTLVHLRNMGNTILIVEHDAETMRAADWIIDLGPGAGALGGEVMVSGTLQEVINSSNSLTGKYLSGELMVRVPNGGYRRTPYGWLTIAGARLFNLKSIEASFPLGVMTCVTGVSGSGKSSLVSETLFPILRRHLHNAQTTPGPYDRLEGIDQVDKVIDITQDPIGRTPRSNPATYVGFFNEIREVFATTPEARQRGYKSGRFSFNVKGGRCEACMGHGQKKIEMHFLPDVWVTCQECKGTRYNRHTLDVRFKGKNIAEVLDMDVREALEFFKAFPKIQRALQTLYDVGLEYVKLGQSATTLSGGEAQRVKLAKELSRVSTGRTVYILDEPTTGLHFADIQRLLDVLHRLTDQGNTVIVIEHNLDVIKSADWIIDLGPEGGAAGGYLLAQGTPEEVASNRLSYTGRFLERLFRDSAHLQAEFIRN